MLLIAIGVVLVTGSGTPEGTPEAAAPTGADAAEEEAGPGSTPDAAETSMRTWEPYAGPATPTEVSVGEGPHSLPEDPCAAFGAETLAGMRVEEDDPYLHVTDFLSSCSWSGRTDDNVSVSLDLEYMVSTDDPESVSQAEERFGPKSDVFGMFGTRLEKRAMDIGDESVLVYSDNRDDTTERLAELLIRRDNMLVEVKWGPRGTDSMGPVLTFEHAEQVMPELGRQALNHLG
ncbi:hypothetical protein HDA32_005742 [Spinactinospora alkalitolerans]|uniref:DUF3558 domain-containing protein n=1 Tax=Spinactinospora alkalitolerans TaxID=687207 RepID=A0A852U535_9ACTN|nr:hypothetical protein [Spinactinospora alkalitolerans]NYE50622.1 hypothetical protein [Spinactinospora alkalitolerans]